MAKPLLYAALAASVLAAAAPAPAQVRGPARYAPSRPTTSPYLTLFNDASGPVTAYYGIVRPLERQALADQRRSDELRRQEQQISNLARDAAVSDLAPTGRGAWFGVGAQRSGFRDTSHYYYRWENRGPLNRR